MSRCSPSTRGSSVSPSITYRTGRNCLRFGMGIIAVVLSPWLTQFQRAVYRDGPAFQRGHANATPLWGPGALGVLMLFICVGWLGGWVEKCVPAGNLNAVGVVFLAFALALALTAVGRLIRERIHLGSSESALDHAAAAPLPPGSSAAASERPPKLPPARRRVIVEFAITYEAAVIVILVGVGLL